MREWIKTYAGKLLPEKNRSTVKENRKKNGLFLLSMLAFFCLSMDNKVGYGIGAVLAMAFYFVLAGQTPNLWKQATGGSRKQNLFYGFSAAGICLGGQSYFYRQTQKLMLPQYDTAFLVLSFLGAAAAFCFVYVCVAVFWKCTKKAVSGTGLLENISRGEKITAVLLVALLSVLVIYAFSESEAFSGTEHLHAILETEFLYDILYTSDSAALLHENAFFALTHPQNDLRQPLFAVFSGPLLGVPYLVGRLGTETLQAVMLMVGQLVLLVAANWMIGRMMELRGAKLLCFLCLNSCMYSNLLFSLMMEQYIVAYFWLAFLFYQICKKNHPHPFLVMAAGGTMLTSMILLPSLSKKHPVKQFKEWFLDMVKYGLGFVGLMLVFARFDIFTSLISSVKGFTGYTTGALTAWDKLFQYTEFVKNCFALPVAGVNTSMKGFASWQLAPVTAINWVGVGLLLLTAVSAVWNWKNKSSRMAALWVGFSVVMLFVLGWGTAENGLILYSLYFGWAFLVLLFQLVERIEETLRIRHLTVICGIAAAGALLAMNIPAILDMIRFAVAYYPA